jgi:hypothetical protein
MCLVINAFMWGIKKAILMPTLVTFVSCIGKKVLKTWTHFSWPKLLRTNYVLGVNCTVLDCHLLHCGSQKSQEVHISSGMPCDGYIYDIMKQLGFSLQTIQPVMSCCTNLAILAAHTRRQSISYTHKCQAVTVLCVDCAEFWEIWVSYSGVAACSCLLGCDVMMAIQRDVTSQKS